MKLLNKFIYVCLLGFSSLSAFSMPEKLYLDSKEMDYSEDRFHIHLGNNVWVESNCLYRDERGMYTLESNVIKSIGVNHKEYERTWKCPYCYNHWPIGVACQNKDCPSKYK